MLNRLACMSHYMLLQTAMLERYFDGQQDLDSHFFQWAQSIGGETVDL